MDNKAIGARMRELREKAGLSTSKLAEKIGTSQAQVSRLETGKQGFRSRTLMKIAKALNVDAVYFFIDDTKPNAQSYGALVSRRVIDAMRSPEYTRAAEHLAALHRKKKASFRHIAGLLETLARRDT